MLASIPHKLFLLIIDRKMTSVDLCNTPTLPLGHHTVLRTTSSPEDNP